MIELCCEVTTVWPHLRVRRAELVEVVVRELRAWGLHPTVACITAQPLYTRFPIIFGGCFPKVTIGLITTRAGKVVREGVPERDLIVLGLPGPDPTICGC